MWKEKEAQAMIIEITRPEVEALIQQRLQRGPFTNPQDVIFDALRSSEPSQPTSEKLTDPLGRKRRFIEVCTMVRGLADDVDFSRDPSPGRDPAL